ncbi:hypothetical protein K504DRAFT_346410, partial [Pleomassaria siparia CBS 279.74]
IPQPATNAPSCSVPIGGSNSTIFDSCCNSHINLIQTDSTSCYLFCTTDSVADVENCLNSKLGPYNKQRQTFQCFNETAKEGGSERIRLGKGILVIMGLGLAASIMG